MTVDAGSQAKLERDHTWERSWPKCFFALVATVEILLALVWISSSLIKCVHSTILLQIILVTEIFNILMDFWHTNVFGGIWASIILLINWILIFVTGISCFSCIHFSIDDFFSLVCCASTVRASTCSFIWNFITLVTFAVLIVFDVIFILNPYTCILTPTCDSQPQSFSFNYIVQTIPQFENYSLYDSKKLFLEIQVGCAGLAFLTSVIYIVVFLFCRLKLRDRAISDNPITAILPPKRGLRIARAPLINPTVSDWSNKSNSTGYFNFWC